MSDANENATVNKAGALKSTFTLELHTNYAIKLWEGRRRKNYASLLLSSDSENYSEQKEEHKKKKKGQNNKWAIIGMPVFIGKANLVHRDSLKNNPFSDMILWRLEKSLDEGLKFIQAELDNAEQWLAQLPKQIHVSGITSSSPLNLEVFSRTPLGYKCVWLLVGFDQFVLRALQAHHYGLISRKKLDTVLVEAGHRVRQAFGVVTRYRSLPISRINLNVESEEYKAAVRIMGDLDHDILKGSKRSSFSPPLASLKW
ncbi:TIGR03761 family integrating conjugative element protein [Xenorhabdus khoisanae]|uniref:PFL_4669 family integrating conjugative element protein n=1 Tax=Xenorhabdus khoisanae TaxID=880157 RepID=UPI002359C997|nr:TIGR03761 family integrating conjugative element protein [Xenorhabdus khoisanae]MDC9612938.1 TIGR03761 family integrating conjugative element protein [Xenorhabdus khoisanae]